MYLKRIQLRNYGPIQDLDIDLPFDGTRPKPVLLVGENGSGKTIVLSHIVNAMVNAKDSIFQESSEIVKGKVLKLRSGTFISVGAEYYYGRTDFEQNLFLEEMYLRKTKSEYKSPLVGMEGQILDAWNAGFKNNENDHFDGNITERNLVSTKRELVSKRCLLYFPSNRAEEPAWLNHANLHMKAQHTESDRFKGKTQRRLIAHSPIREIHDWLYDIAYDRAVFETNIQHVPFPLTAGDTNQNVPLPVFKGYKGNATNVYNLALEILQMIYPESATRTNLNFGIGRRNNRVLALMSNHDTIVPNLFQFSSGEMALLALFLSILRDFDMCEVNNADFAKFRDIKGLVVIDEVDLHLHSLQQYDVLPRLVHTFPNVQFVMTTHSPLFILGMDKMYSKDGFEIYDLPSGSRISPEEFDEFDRAFLAFKNTKEFANEIRTQISKAIFPILYVEGSIDKDYLQQAAKLLGKESVLERFEIKDAGGAPNLKKIWSLNKQLPESTSKTVVLLHDPENNVKEMNESQMHKRKMSFFDDHPIKKGIENLFDQETLEKARTHSMRFIDIIQSHTKTERGKKINVHETWCINEDEKRNLCDWLCINGNSKDFQNFEHIFEILEQIDISFE